MTSVLKAVLACALLALLAVTSIAAEIHEPAKGSPERKAILDAIRPAIERQMKGRVEFVINSINSDGEWAVVIANPQRPGGGEIDPETTVFAGKSDEMDGLTVYALAHQEGGDWSHVTDIIGSMDAAYVSWGDEYGVPKALLGMDQ